MRYTDRTFAGSPDQDQDQDNLMTDHQALRQRSRSEPHRIWRLLDNAAAPSRVETLRTDLAKSLRAGSLGLTRLWEERTFLANARRGNTLLPPENPPQEGPACPICGSREVFGSRTDGFNNHAILLFILGLLTLGLSILILPLILRRRYQCTGCGFRWKKGARVDKLKEHGSIAADSAPEGRKAAQSADATDSLRWRRMIMGHLRNTAALPGFQIQRGRLSLLCIMILGGILLLLLATACGEDSDDTWASLPDCPGGPLFSVLPIAEDRILNCIPLGLYNQPGHVFPSDHQYLDIRKGLGDVTLFSPTGGWIISVVEVLSSDRTNAEWSLELAPCNNLKVIFGHVSALAPDILTRLGTPSGNESYQTGGVTFTRRRYEVKIPVAAGAVIGALYDMPGVNGIDLGVMDRRVVHTFANPRRFEKYGYRHATAFLDYCTPALTAILRDFISSRNETLPLRSTEPLAGTVCLDVSGTAQGLWFAPEQPTYPEDPHLALIRNYTRPEKHVFSVGTSIPGLAPRSYEFLPEAGGIWNRAFDEVAPGAVYIYSNFTGFWNEALPVETVILLELQDAATLRIEKQETTAGPPWIFSPAAVLFER